MLCYVCSSSLFWSCLYFVFGAPLRCFLLIFLDFCHLISLNSMALGFCRLCTRIIIQACDTLFSVIVNNHITYNCYIMLLFCGVLETGACCHTGNLCYNLTESVHFIFQYIIQYHNKIKAHLHTYIYFRNTELHDKS